MYTTRLLPSDEWHRLAGTELGTLTPHLSPEHTRIVVVEHEGVIVGCWAATRLMHLEGAWIAPEKRTSASVGRRLLRGIREALTDMGASFAITGSTSPEVARMVTKCGGQPLPVEWAVIPMGDATCPQQL